MNEDRRGAEGWTVVRPDFAAGRPTALGATLPGPVGQVSAPRAEVSGPSAPAVWQGTAVDRQTLREASWAAAGSGPDLAAVAVRGGGRSGEGDGVRSRQSPRRAELIRSLTRRVQDLDDVMQGMSQLFARRHGLNSTDLRVLMAVYRAEVGGRPLTAGQLAEGVRLSPAAVSYALGRLCESGHLHKEPDPEDGRRVLVRYSQAGLDAAVGFFGPLASVQADVLAGFSVEELDAANRVVAALVGGVAGQEQRLRTWSDGAELAPD